LRSCKTTIITLLFLFIVLTQSALGQSKKNGTGQVDLSEGVVFEITPHTGFMGSSGVFGIKLGMNYDVIAFEFAAEQVIGQTSNLYPISINMILNLTTKGRLIPYGIVGPALFLTVPTNTIGDETLTTVGLNFGGGLRYFFTSSFGVRLEAKQYFTTVENKRDNREELLIFQEISIGVTFLFK
jgi:opacity protein-like surface antigen